MTLEEIFRQFMQIDKAKDLRVPQVAGRTPEQDDFIAKELAKMPINQASKIMQHK
jgi:hypothetical protein